MTRAPLKAVALVATLVVGAVAATGAGPAAAELPTPAAGGPAELLRYTGDPSSATGNAISNGPCDVNGDGYDDAVVGAWFWDKAPTNNIGAAYVVFGGPAARGGSLADPADAGAVRIDGPSVAGATVGFAVACLGDVNGDELDDVAVTYYGAVKTYVVFGAERFTGLALDSLGDRGYSVVGPTGGNFGFSAARVGDLDADGLADFAVAEVAADTQGRTNNGRVWVLAGRDDISDVDLTAPAAGQVLLTVDGAIAEERIGTIASAGDVNGDGIDDFVLGAYTSTPWGPTIAVPGAAYVIFGGPTATGAIDTSALGTKGFTIVGPTRQRDRLGISVSAAGDVDGDGRADLLIGADGVSNAATGNRNGGAAVVFGSASTDRVYTDPLAANGSAVFTCAAPAPVAVGDPCSSPTRRGYWIDGAVAGDATGYSVAGIGDVDADGTPDLALGAYGYDPVNPAGGTFSGGGAVYVVFGRPDAVMQPLGSLVAADGYRIDGTLNGDRFGRQVGLIGDFDGNGTSDLVVGADFAPRNGGSQNGELTVALMGRLVTRTTATGPATARPGDEVTFTATVTKAAGSPAPPASGTVGFSRGGAPIGGCTAVAVTGGTATCATAFAEEGEGDVVATYAGTDFLAGSTAGARPFEVAKTATTTALLPSDDAPLTGQLVQLLAVVDAGAAGPIDTGRVAFTADGTPIVGCSSVAVADGIASCTTSWSTRGARALVADYPGTAQVAGSASAPATVTVGADAVVRPIVATGTYGLRGATIAGEVAGATRIPTGTVTIRDGATTLGTATLVGGRYALTLGPTALPAGTRPLTVSYGGDSRHHPATAPTTVAIAKAKPAVTLTVPATADRTRKVVGTVKVTAAGVVPAGQVKVQVNGSTVQTVTLSPTGAATFTLPAFASAGRRSVRVLYVGSTKVGSGYSSTKIVTVR